MDVVKYGSSNMFSGLGIMPLQLLNLGVIIPRIIYRLFITRTPRGICSPLDVTISDFL